MAKEEQIIESINLATDERIQESIIRDSDFTNRNGYNAAFLNKEVPLPFLNSDLQNMIAMNQFPGKNGEKFLDYVNFSVLFNKEKKLPFYSAVNIEGKSNEMARIHDERGSDYWNSDDRLEIGGENFQFKRTDYTHSNFQRGHMVRFYDPAWGTDPDVIKTAIGDTFHFTNCCPQVGNFNTGVWNDLEDYYMARSIFQDDKISVFTGPIFNKAQEIGKLLVPLNFWKVIVYNKGEGIEAMGFLISHEIAMREILLEIAALKGKKVKPTLKASDIDRLFNKRDLKKWNVKISLIEEKTGLKFGLGDFDINKDKDRLFYANAEHVNSLNLITEFDKFVTKNDNPALIREIERIRFLMDYNSFSSERRKKDSDYTKFIEEI